MTPDIGVTRGFEARLLAALTEVDAARTVTPSRAHTVESRPVRRAGRRRLMIGGSITALALGTTAVATAAGVFDSATPQVKQIFNGMGGSVDAQSAVRIGVIDDHVAYAAPTDGGGFCFYFDHNPRSGPTGGSCVHREAAPDEAVFTVLPGTDGGLLFGRVGTDRAQWIHIMFPRSRESADVTVVDSGFFALRIPDTSMSSLMATFPPGPKDPPVKGGGPIVSFQLDRVPEISVAGIDENGNSVAHGVAVETPEPSSDG